MIITPDQIEKFRQLCQKYQGRHLDTQTAKLEAERMAIFFDLLLRPSFDKYTRFFAKNDG